MAKQPGSPDQIEAFVDKLTAACIRACKNEGTVGEAKAAVVLEGTYSFSKEGSLELDLDIGAKIPDNIPADADVGTEISKEREKVGKGKLTVTYSVVVRTKSG